MGIGDELIAVGQAKRMFRKEPKRRVCIVNHENVARWHPVFDGSPYIIHPSEPRLRDDTYQRLMNCPGHRPYIARKSMERWYWQDFSCEPADLFFSEPESVVGQHYAGRVILEPGLKARASVNKDWGRARWEVLAKLLTSAGVRIAQVGPPQDPPRLLPGAEWIKTTDFRYAAAVLAHSRGAVLHEGGLHHAAAAVACPSVVIFGGFISPRQTGYGSQVNLFTGKEPCGYRVPCEHCKKAMAAITPEQVAAELLKVVR